MNLSSMEVTEVNLARRLYRIAFTLILLAIVAVQLMWLPAPLFKHSTVEWIEVINYFYYSLMLIPLLLVGGASLFCLQLKKNDKLMRTHIGIGISLMVAAFYTCYSIVQIHMLQAAGGMFFTIVLSLLFYILTNKGQAIITVKKALVIGIGYSIILVLLLCPIPYNVMHPCFTFNMEAYAKLAIESDTSHKNKQTNHSIEGVLVADRPAFIIDLLYAKLLPHMDLEKRTKAQLPISEQYSQVVSQKLNSNKIAEAYAWQLYTGKPAIHAIGIRITGFLEHSPATHVLAPGDIIVGIDDKPITTIAMLSEVMSTIKTGQVIEVEVLRATGEQEVVNVTTKASADDENKAALGIYIEQAVAIEEQLKVNYEQYVAHFGGPSHGAMLTLALLNQLQDGALVGERHIAGTGTIELDGSIGMVGGVKQKAYAVSKSTAEVFFVPEQAYEQAKQGAPNLNIIPVKHIDDIVMYLNE